MSNVLTTCDDCGTTGCPERIEDTDCPHTDAIPPTNSVPGGPTPDGVERNREALDHAEQAARARRLKDTTRNRRLF